MLVMRRGKLVLEAYWNGYDKNAQQVRVCSQVLSIPLKTSNLLRFRQDDVMPCCIPKSCCAFCRIHSSTPRGPTFRVALPTCCGGHAHSLEASPTCMTEVARHRFDLRRSTESSCSESSAVTRMIGSGERQESSEPSTIGTSSSWQNAHQEWLGHSHHEVRATRRLAVQAAGAPPGRRRDSTRFHCGAPDSHSTAF